MHFKFYTILEKRLQIILILVIIIRLLAIGLPSFKVDMNSWQAWSARLTEVTPVNFYAPNYFADYFPGYLYILWFLGKSANFLHIPIFSLEFEFYLKLFTNIFDFATAYYIYKIILKFQKNLAFCASIFYLINPALVFNSSVWGQVDGIMTFFLLYSIYNLIELNKPFKFSFSSALSILIKPQSLATFPVTSIYLIRNFNFKKYASFLLIPILLIFFSLPFFLKDPLLGLFHLFQKSTNIYPFTSMFSYNFWSFAGWWISDSTKFLNISYQIWGILIYFIFLFLILLPLFFKKNFKNNLLIYFACALAIFAFFLFLTRIHQRYLFPFFAFLLITALLGRSIKLMGFYLILSIIHFINLWYVYYYYNYVYSNPSATNFIIYNLLSLSYNWLAAINLICFGLLLLVYYRLSFSLKNYVSKKP